MTLPASGPITISNISSEIGQSPSYSTTLNFLNNLIVPAQRPGQPVISAFYSKAYFQNTTQGNCNNGNCATNCNCGNIQCVNCYIAGPVNCANCDTQQWLQTNCNCACTYNCVAGPVSYNCNCGCCVVATALTDDGAMSPRQYLRINVWASRHLDKMWLGERLHRGYHIVAPKMLMPLMKNKNNKLAYKYINWAFSNILNMMMGKKYDKLVWPSAVFWLVFMTSVGIFTSAKEAEISWKSLYKK